MSTRQRRIAEMRDLSKKMLQAAMKGGADYIVVMVGKESKGEKLAHASAFRGDTTILRGLLTKGTDTLEAANDINSASGGYTVYIQG